MYGNLIQAIQNLSLSYKEQKALMPDFVDVFDEINMDFMEAVSFLPQIMEDINLPYSSIKNILNCYFKIDFNLRDETLRSDEAFEHHQKWTEIREIAKEIIKDFKI